MKTQQSLIIVVKTNVDKPGKREKRFTSIKSAWQFVYKNYNNLPDCILVSKDEEFNNCTGYSRRGFIDAFLYSF